MKKVLFVISKLGRVELSVTDIREGREAVSGSISSSLLVADELARRGLRIGLVTLSADRLVDTSIRTFPDLRTGLEWVQGGVIVWCSWGDEKTLAELNTRGVAPWMWTHVHIEPRWIRWLEDRNIGGLIVVSDATRLPFLHSSAYRRIGRVYNPLNPFFCQAGPTATARYDSQAVVFAGFLGESKGAHRVLQMWPYVRERLPHATLTIAGSGKLYGDGVPLGKFGVASQEFEEKYIRVLVERWGSLDRIGIRMAGLMPPVKLVELYRESALGLVNLNWNGCPETFCCTAVEMLATQLPVFSFRVGGLPETIGKSGGSILLDNPDLRSAAAKVSDLLCHPETLSRAGASGAEYVHRNYDLERIADTWETILQAHPDKLDQLSGSWQNSRNARYWITRSCGYLGFGSGLDFCLNVVRRIKGGTFSAKVNSVGY